MARASERARRRARRHGGIVHGAAYRALGPTPVAPHSTSPTSFSLLGVTRAARAQTAHTRA
eukprot:6114235-Prymnesium_polylepis.1